MPLYYLDVHDTGVVQSDDAGTELADREAARKEAMRLLPVIAYDEIPKDGDHRSFVVMVTDEARRPVYSATLTYTGLWLSQ